LHDRKRAECLLVDLGNQDYQESLRIQARIVEKRKQNKVPDCLLFVEYGHTITVGRSGKEDHLLASSRNLEEKNIQVCHTDRGGDITYHGPGQMIAYPILDLKSLRRDIDWYLRTLEACIMATLEDSRIVSRTIPGATGVWVEEEKIAAIGIRTSQWVTSHGFALNINTNLDYFNTIIPCGIRGKGVTSVAKVLRRPFVDPHRIKVSFCSHVEVLFERFLRSDPKEGASILWI
jgi:lipoyl(octanoyl) transferase